MGVFKSFDIETGAVEIPASLEAGSFHVRPRFVSPSEDMDAFPAWS